MLPPALGGLRFRVPPVPDRHAPGSMEKIKLGIAAVLPPLNRTVELYQIALANRKGGIGGKTVMMQRVRYMNCNG